MGSVELAILKAAQEGGYLDTIPEDPNDIVREANYYVIEADKAYKNGMKGDKTIIAIRNLAKKMGEEQDKADQAIFGSDKPKLYRGLPEPEDLHGEPTSLPRDFTELSPKEIRKLHAEYNAYYARARWMLAVATNKLAGKTSLRDAEYRKAYMNAYTIAGEKKPTREVLDFTASSDERVKELNDAVRAFQEDVTSYKALTEIYGGDVDRLSREWTMRQDEDKRNY